MEIRTREEEREYLLKLIFEWNASRLDIFEISQPDENLEYKGVMRFFFQDSGTKDTKVATKCVRVSSKDTTDDVLKVLVEKFRPDMKMLTNPEYRLYEVHPNGEARQLTKIEQPLKVQLEWQKEDREGRFLLKSSKDKVVHSSLFATAGSTTNTNQNFKRRLSKREKKELKKKQQEEAKKNKSNDDTAIAQNLYDELPETSFTRSISNPEAVMRRRRQQKLEKRLKEFQDKEGSDSGGTLKIFAETLKPEIPYKTLLVGMRDTASYVVKEALDKYQMTKEEPEDYCLVMVNVPVGGQTGTGVLGKERVVHDDDCPLAVATTWPSNRGTIVFHLRRRANLPRYRKEKRTRSKSPARVPVDVPADQTAAERLAQQSSVPQHLLPYLAELSPDGYELDHKPQILRLQINLTEIGSEKSPSPKANHILLHGPNILHRHCVVTNSDGRVAITPSSSDAEIYINNKRIKEMTELHHGNVVRLGKLLLFRFFDPVVQNSMKRHSAPGLPRADSGSISSNSTIEPEKSQSGNTYVPNRHSEPVFPIHDQTSMSPGLGSSMSQSTLKDHSSVSTLDEDMDTDQGTMYETTFDVDGDIKTVTSTGPRTSDSEMQQSYAQEFSHSQVPRSPLEVRHDDVDDSLMDKLPATLEFRESGEDAFFAAVISEVNGAAVHFKLAPTYTLYMCCRYRISPWYKRELPPQQRSERLGVTVLKIANMVQSTVRENSQMPGSLAFWMANASELLHFLKADHDTAAYCKDGKQILAQSVQLAFRHLVQCIQYELRLSMPAFLDETDEADQEDSDFESMLDNDGNETLMGGERSFSIQHNRFGRPLSSDNLLGTRRRNGSRPSISDVLYTLSSAMSLLRRCRVNAALTIQVFSQLFHFINMWLFNKLVLEPQLGLCTREWGRKLIKRLGRVDSWAEKQGLELASDCHLCRVIQAAHLLQAPKSSAKDITDISSTCFKLNSIQLRALLQNYRPAHDERVIPQELINNVAAVAENTADELMRSSGQEVQLEEDPELQLPFLLPEDGYSDEVIRGVPPGLKEFLDPLCSTGLCRLTVQPATSGMWTVYHENFKEMGDHPSPLPHTPEIIDVSFNKGRGGMGISIVAAKAAGQDQFGIYIKQVVKEGPAAKDGRLQAGDHILFVNGESLIGVSQEKAAEYLVKAGNVVHLRIAKQGAIHHGLATLLSQPAPMVTREQPRSPQSPTLPDNEIQRSPGRWLSDGRNARVPDDTKYDERRDEERRRAEEEEQWRQEEERKRQEEERRRFEEERKRAEEERRKEDERRREEARRREEEQRRVEEERRFAAEQQRIEEERRFAAEQQRIEEERRREKQLFLEEQRRLDDERRLEEDRRREEQRRYAEEPRFISDEQRRVEQERRQAEERMRVIGEQQKQQRKKKRIRFEDEDEEEVTMSQARPAQQPPRSPYKVKFEAEEVRPVESAQTPRPRDVPVPADLDSHEMPAYTIKFQKAPQPSPAETEVNVRESNSLYSSPASKPYADNRFQTEVSPESLRPVNTGNEDPPKSPVRMESVDTRYGRAIVVTKGMMAQRPATPQRPSVHDHEQREREQRDERDEFQRWQLHEKQMAEERERQLARREQQEKDELERSQRQQRERDEQRQLEAAEIERQERVRQEQEERLRREQERRDRERNERERRDRERQEMIERQRREQNERDQEAARKQQSETRLLERQKRGSTELLDEIETMSADEVEREFKRRLEEENRRREFGESDDGVISQTSASGLVSVTRVQYVSPEREEQLERERKLNLIIGEKEKRDREKREMEMRRKAQEERNERKRRDRQQFRMAQLEKEREQQREAQKRVQEQRDREQEDWLRQQREKREQQRLNQERMRLENKFKEEEEEKRKRMELIQKREQEEALRRTYQVQREQEEERLLREQRGEAARREEERQRQLEQKKLLREKDEELRRQQAGEPPRSRISSDGYHIDELKEKAMIDYERRRMLIDEEIQRQRGTSPRPRYDEPVQRSTNSLLKNSNTNSLTKTKKQVSFSSVTTEITEPTAPTYVVGTSSGYTAIVTPAPSVRLVPSRIPDDDDPPPYTPPEDDDDDLPPPPPPPPPPELLDDDIGFPAPPPPQSPAYGSSSYDDERYNYRASSNGPRVTTSSVAPHDPRDLHDPYGNDKAFREDVPPAYPHSPAQFQRPPPPTSSQDYTSYVTWPRKGRPAPFPTRQDQPPPKPRYGSQDSLDDRVPHSGSYTRAQITPRPWRGSNENVLHDLAEDVRGRVARVSLTDEEKSRDKPSPLPKPEKLNFRDKQKLFNDGTPQDKSRSSRWEREQSRQVNGDITSP